MNMRFTGEFGWQVMGHAPACRRWATQNPSQALTVSAPAGSEALYDDIPGVQFQPVECRRSWRGVAEWLASTPDGYCVPHCWHRRYGSPARVFPVLIHARSITHKREINYQRWDEFVELAGTESSEWACIGTALDSYLDDMADLRGIGLSSLMDLIAGARCVVGVSSGVMHLAAACGTPVVTWYDPAYQWHGESLEHRYRKTWNPHGVTVEWIGQVQPDPKTILRAIESVSGREYAEQARGLL
jgi:hypothetical protein